MQNLQKRGRRISSSLSWGTTWYCVALQVFSETAYSVNIERDPKEHPVCLSADAQEHLAQVN